MGFMDKAKKMAEQAQAKLDEVQKGINSNPGSGASPGGGPWSSTTSTGARSPRRHRPTPPRRPRTATRPAPPPRPRRHRPCSSGAARSGCPRVLRAAGASAAARSGAAAPPPPAAARARVGGPAGCRPALRPPPSPPKEDRNNPSYEPPKLSSGDPLAGG